MIKIGVFTVSLLALAGCAQEPQGYASDGSPIYGGSFRPTDEDGIVVLNCMAELDGSLTDCRVVTERPEGLGLADVVLAKAAEGRVKPKSSPTRRRVQFTTRFRLEQ